MKINEKLTKMLNTKGIY